MGIEPRDHRPTIDGAELVRRAWRSQIRAVRARRESTLAIGQAKWLMTRPFTSSYRPESDPGFDLFHRPAPQPVAPQQPLEGVP
jgi:hypothetical protein